MLRLGKVKCAEPSEPIDKGRELRQLRQGLRRVCADRRLGDDERALSRILRASRERIARELGQLQVCSRCAAAYPLPASTWDGGYCCSGRTDALFDELELAALGQAGTRPRHMRPPRSAAAGCIFRGPTGCSLPPKHRPNICLRYLCTGAQRELHARGILAQVEALCQENEQQFAYYARCRMARLEDFFCDDLIRRLR